MQKAGKLLQSFPEVCRIGTAKLACVVLPHTWFDLVVLSLLMMTINSMALTRKTEMRGKGITSKSSLKLGQ